MSLGGMAFRRVRKLLAWAVAVGVLGLVALGLYGLVAVLTGTDPLGVGVGVVGL
jgi:hypothetical protein